MYIYIYIWFKQYIYMICVCALNNDSCTTLFCFWNRDCSFGFPGTIQINPILSPCFRSQYILQNSSSCNLHTQQTFQIFSHSAMYIHIYIYHTLKFLYHYRYHISLESNQKAPFWGCKLPSMKHGSLFHRTLPWHLLPNPSASHAPQLVRGSVLGVERLGQQEPAF